LAAALDHFKPSLGDVAMVLAFTGLRWEEAVAIPIQNVDLDGQWITVDRTASESGGRRDIRAALKTRAAERVVAIPDIARPDVRRLAESGAAGRELSEGRLYSRLINGERGGYLGYAIWRRYLKLAHSHRDRGFGQLGDLAALHPGDRRSLITVVPAQHRQMAPRPNLAPVKAVAHMPPGGQGLWLRMAAGKQPRYA
jgi:integrase